MDYLRLFTAVHPPSPTIEVLLNTQRRMREQLASDCVRWVGKTNLHLTLQFLGDVDRDQVDTVKECIRSAINAVGLAEPITLTATEVGAFPNAARARLIWAGVADETERLASVDRELRQQLKQAGITFDEKPFRPHITLGYVRRRVTPENRRQIATAIREVEPSVVTFPADRLSLVQSTLTPQGARYTDLYSAELGPASNATSSGDRARE